ncbi:MAG: DUF1015 domain-containing protein [Chitinophagales bacterium]
MATIKAFKGFRPPQNLAAQVASRPYDVLNRAEAKAESNPNSFLRVIRAEIDLPDSLSAYDDQVYAQAKTNFDQFVTDEVLVQDEQDCLYVYAQTMNGRRQIGLVCGVSTADYWNDVVKKHEYTRPKKEKDRITHIKTMRVQTGPVLNAYPQVPEIDAIIDQVVAQTATYDFTLDDGVRHEFWVVSDADTIDQLIGLFAEKVPAIYIADGHHRAASSSKVARMFAEANPEHAGGEDYNYFLNVVFPDNQLDIIDYNRVVTDLGDLTSEQFLAKIAENFDIEPAEDLYKPAQPYEYSLYLDGKWHKFTAKSHLLNPDHPIQGLDIDVLSRHVLEGILGIKDQRTDERIDFVGGIRGIGELKKRVDSGDMRLAIAIHPVTIAQLIRVADSGEVMPPKSTWFEPKLRSGLVCYQF